MPGSFAAKAIGVAVGAKAVLMAMIVTALGATTFGESLVLVLVSACATGVFGLVIVLVQTHAERALHERMNTLEAKADTAADAAGVAAARAETIVQAVTQGEGQ